MGCNGSSTAQLDRQSTASNSSNRLSGPTRRHRRSRSSRKQSRSEDSQSESDRSRSRTEGSSHSSSSDNMEDEAAIVASHEPDEAVPNPLERDRSTEASTATYHEHSSSGSALHSPLGEAAEHDDAAGFDSAIPHRELPAREGRNGAHRDNATTGRHPSRSPERSAAVQPQPQPASAPVLDGSGGLGTAQPRWTILRNSVLQNFSPARGRVFGGDQVQGGGGGVARASTFKATPTSPSLARGTAGSMLRSPQKVTIVVGGDEKSPGDAFLEGGGSDGNEPNPLLTDSPGWTSPHSVGGRNRLSVSSSMGSGSQTFMTDDLDLSCSSPDRWDFSQDELEEFSELEEVLRRSRPPSPCEELPEPHNPTWWSEAFQALQGNRGRATKIRDRMADLQRQSRAELEGFQSQLTPAQTSRIKEWIDLTLAERPASPGSPGGLRSFRSFGSASPGGGPSPLSVSM